MIDSVGIARDVEPLQGTVERWCWDLIHSLDLSSKFAPRRTPDLREGKSWEPAPVARRIQTPGRPHELLVAGAGLETPRGTALRDPRRRAQLVHTFLHHELQAAELFAWAVLAFPSTPLAFRRGLVALALEELAHLRRYADHLEHLGSRVGDFPVRDWMWERVTQSETPEAFVALLGVGLEGANLEHAARFAHAFRDAGDVAGAEILERIERDETAHVAFAVKWFEELTGRPLAYSDWREALPRPLTPALLRGKPLNRRARSNAGMSEAFLDALVAEPPTTTPSPR